MDATTASLLPSTSVRTKGFTLIELMIAVVIVAILAAVAYPSYIEYVNRGRRGEAKAALLKIQQAQERWRSNNQNYGELSSVNNDLAPYGVTLNSENGYYVLSVPKETATSAGYIATATVNSSGAQKNDSKCTSLKVTMSNGAIAYGSTGTGTSNYCWGR